MMMYSLTNNDLEANGNSIKDKLLTYLAVNGHIPPSDAAELSKHLAVLLRKPSTISSVWRKILGKEKADNPRYMIAWVSVDNEPLPTKIPLPIEDK